MKESPLGLYWGVAAIQYNWRTIPMKNYFSDFSLWVTEKGSADG